MSSFPTIKITIYHKNKQNRYERYVKEASFRDTTQLSRTKNDVNSKDKATIRIFDVKGYNKSIFITNTSSTLNLPLNSFLGDTWKVDLGDIVVKDVVKDEIQSSTPITELSKKYGKENVFKINNITLNIYNDKDIEELNHIKVGCI